MPDSPIRVLLVDDSPLVLKILGRLFESSPDVEVVGTSANGAEALEQIEKLQPAVVCTDLHMPVMNGLELTRRIMEECPRPILIISSAVQEGSDNVFELLQAGALDVFSKPKQDTHTDYDHVAAELVGKVRVLAGVRVFRRRAHKVFRGASPGAQQPPRLDFKVKQAPQIVAIGASTGGPRAFRAILSALPADLAVPVVCVQHIGADFLEGFVSWLDASCPLHVKIAQHGEALRPGTVHIAPADAHLEISANRTVTITRGEPFEGHRPSATVLFNSVAERLGSSSVGVLLTGIGKDGAVGLAAISKAGGTTIAQDKASCDVFGMPESAIELGAAQHIMALNGIASKLKQLCAYA